MELIFNFILVIVCVVIIAFIVNLFSSSCDIIKFDDTFNILNVPVATFDHDGKALSFIIDSGSSLSHIRPSALQSLGMLSSIDADINIITSSVSVGSTKICTIPILYKNKRYIVDFTVVESLESSMQLIEDTHGIKIHGILGCDFLTKNKYVIDFNGLIAYNKG